MPPLYSHGSAPILATVDLHIFNIKDLYAALGGRKKSIFSQSFNFRPLNKTPNKEKEPNNKKKSSSTTGFNSILILYGWMDFYNKKKFWLKISYFEFKWFSSRTPLILKIDFDEVSVQPTYLSMGYLILYINNDFLLLHIMYG